MLLLDGDIRSLSRLCVKPRWYRFNQNGWKTKMWAVNSLKKYFHIRGKLTEGVVADLGMIYSYFHSSIWRYFCKVVLSTNHRFIIFPSFRAYGAWYDNVDVDSTIE